MSSQSALSLSVRIGSRPRFKNPRPAFAARA
jgi:hypothetical protein